MKKTMRFFALVLSLIMLLAMLAGCNSDDASDTTGTVPTTAVPAATPTQSPDSPSEEVPGAGAITYPLVTDVDTITMWMGMPPFIYNNVDIADYGSTNIIFQAAEEATGIHVAVTAVTTANEPAQYSILIAAEEYCDIMADSTKYSGGADAAVADDVLLELSPYLEAYAPDYYNSVMQLEDYVRYLTTDSGNIVNFMGRSYSTGISAIIRQDWLEALNLDAPVTYDDYYNVLMAFKVEYNPTLPIAMLVGGSPNANSLSSGFGIDFYLNNMGISYEESFYAVDGEVKFGLAEPEFKDYLAMLNKWYDDGLINPDFVNCITTMSPDITSAIAAGTVGIWYGGDDYFAADYQTGDPNYDALAITDPVMKKGDTLHTGEPTMPRGRPQGYAVTVSAKSECPEVVLMWLNYFFTEEGIQLANYGIEGVTYEYVNGSIEFLDIIAAPTDLTQFAAKAIYTGQMMPNYGIKDRWMSIMSDEEQATVTDVWNSNRDMEWLYYGTLTAEEGEDFNVLFADINTLGMESIAGFITGEKSLDNFDSFVTELYNLRLEQCIAYKQAAYNRYMAR